MNQPTDWLHNVQRLLLADIVRVYQVPEHLMAGDGQSNYEMTKQALTGLQIIELVLAGREDEIPGYEPPPLTVSRLECWFWARRLQLLQRGVPFGVAHGRAMRLARYMEGRWPKGRGNQQPQQPYT